MATGLLIRQLPDGRHALVRSSDGKSLEKHSADAGGCRSECCCATVRRYDVVRIENDECVPAPPSVWMCDGQCANAPDGGLIICVGLDYHDGSDISIRRNYQRTNVTKPADELLPGDIFIPSAGGAYTNDSYTVGAICGGNCFSGSLPPCETPFWVAQPCPGYPGPHPLVLMRTDSQAMAQCAAGCLLTSFPGGVCHVVRRDSPVVTFPNDPAGNGVLLPPRTVVVDSGICGENCCSSACGNCTTRDRREFDCFNQVTSANAGSQPCGDLVNRPVVERCCCSREAIGTFTMRGEFEQRDDIGVQTRLTWSATKTVIRSSAGVYTWPQGSTFPVTMTFADGSSGVFELDIRDLPRETYCGPADGLAVVPPTNFDSRSILNWCPCRTPLFDPNTPPWIRRVEKTWSQSLGCWGMSASLTARELRSTGDVPGTPAVPVFMSASTTARWTYTGVCGGGCGSDAGAVNTQAVMRSSAARSSRILRGDSAVAAATVAGLQSGCGGCGGSGSGGAMI